MMTSMWILVQVFPMTGARISNDSGKQHYLISQ